MSTIFGHGLTPLVARTPRTDSMLLRAYGINGRRTRRNPTKVRCPPHSRKKPLPCPRVRHPTGHARTCTAFVRLKWPPRPARAVLHESAACFGHVRTLSRYPADTRRRCGLKQDDLCLESKTTLHAATLHGGRRQERAVLKSVPTFQKGVKTFTRRWAEVWRSRDPQGPRKDTSVALRPVSTRVGHPPG
jgi:hypothetical protein